MNRSDQGPVLLAVAGSLLLVAVVAFTIDDADSIMERRTATTRNRELLREQATKSAEDRKLLNAEMDRIGRARTDFSDQQKAIIESLKRLERPKWSLQSERETDL
jgi:hypothetical protein